MIQGGVHLFVGADRVGKLQRIQQLERSLTVQPLDRHHVDAGAMTSSQLLALCRQQPAVSPVRLIIVEEAHRLDRAGVEALLHHAAVIAQSAYVALLVEVELSDRYAIAKLAGAVSVERFPEREGPVAKPFALTEALGRADVAGALEAARAHLVRGKEPLELLGLIAWQLQRWITAKRLLSTGVSVERLADLAGLRPWQAQRVHTEVAGRPLASLQQLLARCWELDVDAKRGRALPELAVEELIVDVCGPHQSLAGAGLPGESR